MGLNQSEKERGKFSPKSFPRAVLCGQEEKMIAITVTDFMVNSASQVYYQVKTTIFETPSPIFPSYFSKL